MNKQKRTKAEQEVVNLMHNAITKLNSTMEPKTVFKSLEMPKKVRDIINQLPGDSANAYINRLIKRDLMENIKVKPIGSEYIVVKYKDELIKSVNVSGMSPDEIKSLTAKLAAEYIYI